MAMIDSSIYFQQKTADPMGSYAEGVKMGDMMRQQRKQKDIEDAYKAGIVQNPDGTVSRNEQITMKAMMDKGYGNEAWNLQDQINQKKADQLKQQTERAKQTSELLNNTLYNINNAKTPEERQAAYSYGLKQGATMGLDVSSLSPTFTPEVHNYLKNAAAYATDAKFKQDQQDKDRTYQLAQDKFEFDKTKEKNQKDKGDINIANELRKERNNLPTTKATQDVAVAYNKIQNAAKNPTAAGDLSLIFGYMKMLDPGSTVREGEFANAQNAAGVPSQIINAYNRIKNGERLNEEQRQDFMGQAGKVYQAQMDIQNQIDSKYSELANANGVKPEHVIVNYNANQSPNKQTLSEKPAAKTIKVVAPNGMIKEIPENKLNDALRAGGKLAPQQAGW